MSKSSLMLGLVVAIVLHALLFVPVNAPERLPEPALADPDPVPPVTMIDPPPPVQPPPVKPPQPDPPADPPPQMQQIAQPPAPQEDPGEQPGKTSPEDISDDALPPLRITWNSPDQLRQVARSLGMRIVAVNFQGQVVGEVNGGGATASLGEFSGQLSHYSNRVRTLPSGFFGSSLTDGQREIAELWILVPAGVDRAWMDLQKQAIAQTGLAPERVRAIECRFADQAGAWRLVVTRVVSKGS